MGKLRLIKKRESNINQKTDLRGLGDLTEFHSSYPKSTLLISDVSDSSLLNHALHKYKLASAKHETRSIHLITSANAHDGTHEIDAVTLFFAALEILTKDSSAKGKLVISSQLHTFISAGLGNAEIHEQYKPETWLASFTDKLTIQNSIATFLEQAGFELVRSNSTDLHLNETDLRSVTEKLLEQSQSTRHEAKKQYG